MFLDKIGKLFETPMKKRKRRKMLFDLLSPKIKFKIERRISRLEARVNHLEGDNSSNITYEDNSYSSNMYMV